MFHYVARRKQMVKIFFFFFQSNSFSFVVLVHAYRKKNFTNRARLIFQNLDEFGRKEISNFFPTSIREKKTIFLLVISRFSFFKLIFLF